MLLGVELVIHHAALGFPQTLDDDLLAVAGSNAAEFYIVHGDVDDVADLILGGKMLGFSQGHFVGRIHIVLFIHHGLLDEHLERLMLFVGLHDHVFHALMVPLVSGGDCLNDFAHHEGLRDPPLFFQHCHSGEDLRRIHAHGLLLLLAFHLL